MDPNNELFCAADFAGTPLLAAIESLAELTDHSLTEFESMQMRELVAIARGHFGEDLPEIWKIWIDWNEGDHQQPMGDL